MIFLAVHGYAVVAPSQCETVEVTRSVTIEGDDINRLPDEVRKAAGTFDNVSAAYRAAWWGSCGALIGRRVGDTVLWSDGTQ